MMSLRGSLLSRAAEEVYREFARSEEAKDKLFQRILLDNVLIKEACHQAAENALLAAQRVLRKEIEDSVLREDARQSMHRVHSREYQQRVTNACKKIFDWPMRNGNKIQDATLEHLLMDAEAYEQAAAGNLSSAHFLRLVAEKVKPGQKVKQVYTDKELDKLFVKSKRER